MVLLLRDNSLLWFQDVANPWVARVANDGTVIVIDCHQRLDSTLGGTLIVYDSQGRQTLKKEFDSNLNDCGITGDGRVCFVSTLAPDNSLYSFGVPSGAPLWKLKDKDASVGMIRVNEDRAVLEIRDRQGLGVQRMLDFNGKPVPSEAEESRSKIIAVSSDSDSTEAILELLSSSNAATVVKTLERLKFLLSRKRVFLKADRLVPLLKSLYKSDAQRVSQMAFDDLAMICERHLERSDGTLQFLISSLESTPFDTQSLFRLTKLARIDSGLLSSLVPRIREALASSPEWNERRYAAFAIGEIGTRRPDLVKDCIPFLVHYISNPEDIKEKPIEARFGNIRIRMPPPSAMLGVNPEVWLKDAAIDAIGDIGSADAKLVVDSIPVLEKVAASDQSPFSRKKAQRALQSIRNPTAKMR